MNSLEFKCPACGAEVHPNSRGCGKCGARRETHGWSRPETCDGLDLPGDESDEDFDYQEFVEREFGEKSSKDVDGKKVVLAVIALITLIAFFLVYGMWPG